MEDQYGMGDLRQYIGIGSRALFPPPPDLNPYDMLIFRSDSTASVTTNAGGASALGGFENGGGCGTGRWPRQETLTLLEIRSRLDPKFKEANQKGPLWDEVSRIMCEEHGYQRSGKKCREKFENLYKYYKKTKEGKAGRQDGKHYRFFRQLEALYGETNHNNPSASENNHTSFYPNFKNQDTSLSLSNYSDADTSSSENSDGMQDKKISGKTEWKLKMKDFIDSQMKKVMDKQEAWMEKMMRTIEQKEHERMLREEEWRKQDAARVEREHKYWASERAWIEARDAALMEALNKLTSEQTSSVWPESEVNRLLQVRSVMEERFVQTRGGVSEEVAWEEVSARMACFGHERSGISCKEKWDSVNNYLLKCSSNKKRMKSCYYQGHESISNQGGVLYGDQGMIRLNDNENGNENSSLSTGNATIGMSDSCFRYFMGDAYGRITD